MTLPADGIVFTIFEADSLFLVPVMSGGQNINLELSPIFLQKSVNNFEKFLHIFEAHF